MRSIAWTGSTRATRTGSSSTGWPEELALHPRAVEDSLAHAERSKATRFGTHTFLTVYATSFQDDGKALDGME